MAALQSGSADNPAGLYVLLTVMDTGLGTAFRIWLPQTTDSPHLATDAPQDTAAQASGTILVVGDHDGVRDLVTSVLRSFGYHILGIDTAEEALLLAVDYPAPIDLLMTDVVLPCDERPRAL
jgi:hypothetical protein